MRYIFRLLLLALCAVAAPAADLQPKTLAAWDKYVRFTEKRIEGELQSDLKAKPSTTVQIARLHTVDDSLKRIEAPDGMIHHWKGSIFIPNVGLDQVLKFVQDYGSHSKYFREVEKSRLLSHKKDDTFNIFYRLKRTKVITVVYNTSHTVRYRRPAPNRVAAKSEATKIAELDNPGTASETEKTPGNDSGFLWRLNSYWRYEEQNGGVLVECESISLSRDIPFGLAWMIKGFVESVPRESLNGTLTSLAAGIKK